jgi:chemotaxis protein histidine kinase CheA
LITDLVALIADFQTEVAENLNTLDEQLLRLERDPADAQPVRAMFLAAHSIKGGAAMLGIDELRDLAHALEDVLGVLRDDRRPFERALADVMYRTVDRLRALLPDLDGAPHPSSADTLALVAELAQCVTPASTTRPTPPSLDVLAAAPAPADEAPRVLLVEDSPSVRQVETLLLQEAGFVVDAAEAGNAAVEQARRVRYVLVIAGVETRELRGPDLVLALRASASEPPVPVVLTMTDYGPSAPAATIDVAFGPKGRLGSTDFLRAVHGLMASVAA